MPVDPPAARAAPPIPTDAQRTGGEAAPALLELTLALRLLPRPQGLGCSWQLSLHSDGREALQCDSIAELTEHLVRLLQSLPAPAAPHRGIR